MQKNQITSSVPVSVVVGTSSYTIPDGHYAKVKACVVGTQTFSVNGTAVLKASSNSQTTNTSSSLQAANYTGRPLRGIGTLPITDSHSSTSSIGAAFGYGSSTFNFVNSMDYTLPEGTVINGGSYCCELYRL